MSDSPLSDRHQTLTGAPAVVLADRDRRRTELRGVIAMTIPMVITTSSRAFMDIVDYTMITRLHVDEAQAAILPAQIVMFSYMVVGVGIASLVSSLASQALGAKRPHEGSAYAWQALYLAAGFGLIALALRPLLPDLVAWLGHEPAVQSLELAYSRVALLTAAPTIAAYSLGWFFTGIHRPWITMWSAVEANVVNIAVSYVLIFGHLGFEPMGIAGAAWGTLAAVSYRTIRLGWTFLAPTTASRFHSRRTWRPSWSRLVRLVRVGLPVGLQWLCDVAVWAVFVIVLVGRRFDITHLIATNTAWQYMRIAFMPTMGVGQALTALVGKSIGAGHPERAMRETRVAALITLAYMGTLSLVYALIGGRLIALFNADPEVVRIGRLVMYCAACFQLFDGVAICYSSALRGAGDTFVPSAFFIVSNWVIIAGGGWLMTVIAPQLGSIGPWLAASCLIITTGVFLWWRWHSRAWMKIDLLGSRTSPQGHGLQGPPEALPTAGPGGDADTHEIVPVSDGH